MEAPDGGNRRRILLVSGEEILRQRGVDQASGGRDDRHDRMGPNLSPSRAALAAFADCFETGALITVPNWLTTTYNPAFADIFLSFLDLIGYGNGYGPARECFPVGNKSVCHHPASH
jgi:hypothetical protein